MGWSYLSICLVNTTHCIQIKFYVENSTFEYPSSDDKNLTDDEIREVNIEVRHCSSRSREQI